MLPGFSSDKPKGIGMGPQMECSGEATGGSEGDSNRATTKSGG